jgi:hypothetical protein
MNTLTSENLIAALMEILSITAREIAMNGHSKDRLRDLIRVKAKNYAAQ